MEIKTCGADAHGMHMCQLKAKGCRTEMERFSANATVRCGRCGVQADVADHVCMPVPL